MMQMNPSSAALNQRRRDRSHQQMMMQNPQFQPQPTTTQNVELIHGYFSSGEEEGMAFPVNLKNKKIMRQGFKSQSKQNFGMYPARMPHMYQPGAFYPNADEGYVYNQNGQFQYMEMGGTDQEDQYKKMRKPPRAQRMMQPQPGYGGMMNNFMGGDNQMQYVNEFGDEIVPQNHHS